jgi:hypothetical protein
MFGQDGSDTITATDGAADAQVSCGDGDDYAFVDGALDAATSDCDTVDS